MLLKTYIKNHPDLGEFFVQSGQAVAVFNTKKIDDPDCMRFGNYVITKIEEVEGEPVTLHIK